MGRRAPGLLLSLCALAFVLSQALPTSAWTESPLAPTTLDETSGNGASGTGREAQANLTAELPYSVFLPLVNSPDAPSGCPAIPDETYTTLTVNPPPTDRPADKHPDLNLAIRGYIPTTGTLGLVDLAGSADSRAPQLPGLFVDKRTGVFVALFQVYDWDWANNKRGAPITDPPVTLAGLQFTPREKILVPGSGYNIGTATRRPLPGKVFLNTGPNSTGYQVLVLYAAPDRITLKYTRDDNVIYGYTLHVEQVCVEPRLLALYNQMNSAGRGSLPALKAGQAFGTAINAGIGVAIRDTGSFLDPRSHKDWWQGR